MYSSKAQLKPAGRNRTRAFFVGRLVQQRPPSSFVRHHVVVVVVTRRGSTRKTDTTTRRGEKGGGARGGRLIHADCARARGARCAQYNGGGGEETETGVQENGEQRGTGTSPFSLTSYAVSHSSSAFSPSADTAASAVSCAGFHGRLYTLVLTHTRHMHTFFTRSTQGVTRGKIRGFHW